MGGVEGYMYPNEVTLYWSVLIVLYPYITGLVAGAFILASLVRVVSCSGGRAHVQAGVAHSALVSAGCAAASAVSPWPSGAFAGDVLHAARNLGNGNVRLCVPVVPDGGAGV